MRLLQHSLITYIVYSIIVVLVAIPVFYFTINKMFLSDVDETLIDSKTHLTLQLANSSAQDIINWNDPEGNIKIIPLRRYSSDENIKTISLYDTLSHEGEDFRQLTSTAFINGKPYKMIIRLSMIGSEDLSQGIVTTQVILLVVLLAGLILLTLQQSKRIWKPFYDTLEYLKLFEIDKHPDIHLDKTKVKEFNELNEAISQLISRNHRVYLQQKEFTANAAHELQTPLAAMQSRLELMVQEKGLPEVQVRNIQSLGQSVMRMNRLNKGLLLLAKIDNKQFKDIRSFEVQPIIERVLQRSGSPLGFKHLNVTCSCQKVTINSNIVLVDILISNLIRNAIQYTADGGYIKIFSGNGNVEISNTGQPLSFPKEYLFHRFQRGNMSKTSEGNGLGLAIVKQISDTCNFDISYHYEDGMHLFRIKF